MTRSMLLALVLLAPTPAHAQSDDGALDVPDAEKPTLAPPDDMGPEVWAGLGAGMLAAGVGLNALMFLVTDESAFRDSSGEGGLALAIPPVLVAGGLEMLTIGVAQALGADDLTALRIGGLTNLLFGLALGAVALAIGVDPNARVGNFEHDYAAAYLATNGAASFLVGGATFALSF
jgi:hypothetical protein